MALTKIDDRGLKTPIDLLDNEKIRFGTGNDLEIYHDGSHSWIKDTGTGFLIVGSNTFGIKSANVSESIAWFKENGSVDLYYDNSKKFETTSNGITVTGNYIGSDWIKAQADNKGFTSGASDDLQIYHDGTHSRIVDNGANATSFQTDELRIHDAAANEYIAKFVANGAVELYYDNSRKLRTLSNGVELDDNLYLLDSKEIRLGSGEDFRFYHDGSDSYIDEAGSGDLKIRSTSGIQLQNGSEKYLACHPDGAVELYYDNSKKVETKNWGAEISGGLKLNTDSEKIYIGTGNDLLIYHNGSNSYLSNTTGWLQLRSDNTELVNYANDEYKAKFVNNGSVELYYDGSKKFETLTSGTHTYGHSYHNDNHKVILGSDEDLSLYHTGSDAYLLNSTGVLHFRNDGEFKWQKNNGSFVGYIDPDGETRVYHNASQKIVTTSSGCTVYGTVNETSDIALKTNIEPIDNVLDKIQQITGYTYQFKDTGHDSMGVTAQDVEKVFPELVQGEEGAKTLQYSGLIGALIESVKELSNKVAALEAK